MTAVLSSTLFAEPVTQVDAADLHIVGATDAADATARSVPQVTTVAGATFGESDAIAVAAEVVVDGRTLEAGLWYWPVATAAADVSGLVVLSAADALQDTALAQEVTDRTNADALLNTVITAEVTTRANGDITLGTALNQESTDRIAEDAVLDAKIDAQVLGDHADVNAPAPADGDALRWNALSSMWVSAADVKESNIVAADPQAANNLQAMFDGTAGTTAAGLTFFAHMQESASNQILWTCREPGLTSAAIITMAQAIDPTLTTFIPIQRIADTAWNVMQATEELVVGTQYLISIVVSGSPLLGFQEVSAAEEALRINAPSHGMNAATLEGQGLTRGVYDAGTVRIALTTEDHDVLMLNVIDADTLTVALPHHAYKFPLLAPILDTLGPQTLLYRSNTADGAWSDPVSGDAIAIYHGDGWIETLVAPDTHPPVTTATVFQTTAGFGLTGNNVWTDIGAFVEMEGDTLDIAYGNGVTMSLPLHGDGTAAESYRPSLTNIADTIEARVFGGQLQLRSSNGATGFMWARVRRSQRVKDYQTLNPQQVQFEAGLSDGDLLKLDTTTTPWTLRQEPLGAVEREVITRHRDQTVAFGDLNFMCPSSGGSSLQMRRGSSPSMSITQFSTKWSNQQGGASEQAPNFTVTTSWRHFRAAGLNLTQHNNWQEGTFVCNGWLYHIQVIVGNGWNSNRFSCTRWRM